MSATRDFTKRDEINSRNSIALQEIESGETLTVTKAALLQRPDLETGEVKEVAVLVLDDGTAYTSISGTVCDVMDDIMELIDEEGPVKVRLNKRKSKAGREFLSLNVL